MASNYEICQARYDAMLPPGYEDLDNDEGGKVEEVSQEELLEVYMEVLERLAGFELNNIQVQASIGIGRKASYGFQILVFAEDNNNRSFTAYDWQNLDAIKKTVGLVLDAISHDDFKIVEGANFDMRW